MRKPSGSASKAERGRGAVAASAKAGGKRGGKPAGRTKAAKARPNGPLRAAKAPPRETKPERRAVEKVLHRGRMTQAVEMAAGASRGKYVDRKSVV